MEIKYHDGKTFQQVWKESARGNRNLKSYLMSFTNGETKKGRLQRNLIQLVYFIPQCAIVVGLVYLLIR